MSINNIINQSKGKWSEAISDLDYAFIKNAADNTEEEFLSDETIESALKELPDAPNNNLPKRKWLKRTICSVLQDPKTTEELKRIPLEDAKKKLLALVTDAIILLIPGIGIIAKAVIKIIVYFIKRALKKGIDNWCAI